MMRCWSRISRCRQWPAARSAAWCRRFRISRRCASERRVQNVIVMAGLDPAIHDFCSSLQPKNVDARHKAGHDEERLLGDGLPVNAVPMQFADDAAFSPVALTPRLVGP